VTSSMSVPQPGLVRRPLAGLMPVLILATTVVGATSAQAVPFFTVTGGTSFQTELESFLWVTPRVNDEVVLWEGATVGLSEPGFITLEYIGKEALFANNIFRWNGTDIFSTGPGDPLITGQTAATPFPPAALATYVVPGVVSAGTLPFSFFITALNTAVPNDGSNLDIGIWPIPNDLSGSSIDFGTSIYLMLDDENTADTDHDDMIVRMTVTPVPEPGTLALVGVAALPLVGWLGARRRTGRKRAGAGWTRFFRGPLDAGGGGG
jgi:hypothetical protein